MPYSKKEFWRKIPKVQCSICDKKYRSRAAMIGHFMREHNMNLTEAVAATNSTNIYVPNYHRVKRDSQV